MDQFGASEKLLRKALTAAVPMWVIELQNKPRSYIDRRRLEISKVIDYPTPEHWMIDAEASAEIEIGTKKS